MLANYAIGQSYFKGKGVKKNYKLALESFKKAALMGHASSKINLGSIYYFGYGINKNHPKAYLWWRLALDQNANGAEENLNTLQKVIDSKDLSKGVSLYNKCLKMLLMECLK